MFLRSIAKKTAAASQLRGYATSSSSNGGSFFYRYGTPLVKCTVLASATTMAYQLLWQHLEYEEYRDDAEKHIGELENRIKTLEESGRKVASA